VSRYDLHTRRPAARAQDFTLEATPLQPPPDRRPQVRLTRTGLLETRGVTIGTDWNLTGGWREVLPPVARTFSTTCLTPCGARGREGESCLDTCCAALRLSAPYPDLPRTAPGGLPTRAICCRPYIREAAILGPTRDGEPSPAAGEPTTATRQAPDGPAYVERLARAGRQRRQAISTSTAVSGVRQPAGAPVAARSVSIAGNRHCAPAVPSCRRHRSGLL
jgi:hypothetical protein